jgi:hypothetical protein
MTFGLELLRKEEQAKDEAIRGGGAEEELPGEKELEKEHPGRQKSEDRTTWRK